MNAWGWMAAAVLTQWTSVAALRASDGLRRRALALLMFAAMVASVASVSQALHLGLTVAIAYGVWTGAGVALAALTGVLAFGDRLSRVQWAGVALVLLGVGLLQVR